MRKRKGFKHFKVLKKFFDFSVRIQSIDFLRDVMV